MKGDANKQFDDLLEDLRALGHPELAGQVLVATRLEAEMNEKLRVAHQEMMDEAEALGLPEMLACATACQVYSHAYAIGIALLELVTPTKNRTELLATALRSLMGNLDRKFTDTEALVAKVGDKVKKAAHNVGPLPDMDQHGFKDSPNPTKKTA